MAAAAIMAFTAATAQDFGETIPSVTVNGSSQLKVTPDILYLSISLDESDSKGKITLDEQRKAMFSALRKCGINIEKQLSVADMSSSFFKRRSSLSSSQYELKVSTADEARKVFDALNAAGITNVDLTRVACSKLDEYRTEARMAAIRNAKERAGHQVSVGYVAKQLKDAGIIKYMGLFQLYCSVSHAKTKIDPGTYELSTNYDYRALVKKMQVGSGAMVTTKVTIPEGYTMEQIFRKLEDENVCSYDDLMDAAANYSYNYSFIDQSMQGDAKRLEGFLFPDTYEFYQGMQASSAINKFLENFHDRITAEMLEKADERGMTMQEVVTVASMIEKEAANDDERAMIAAVIYNRIAAGMPLQIDSTIMYVLPEHKDVLTVEDTKIDSPYNTYQNKGLPPTPIANPGLASIKATLSPASTKALYYALDSESGTHKFFTSYGEFQAFVAKQSYSQ